MFARVSGLFQVGLVLAVGYVAFVAPLESLAIVDAFKSPPAPGTGWALSMPAAWCLAVYERVLGGPLGGFTILRRLSSLALLTLGGTFAVAVLSNAVAFRRVMRGAVELSTRPSPVLRTFRTAVVRLVARRPGTRAIADFLLISLARVERLRLALAVGVGLAVACAVPVLTTWSKHAASPQPVTDILTLPITLMVLWLTALRVAISLPADLRASWLFDVVRPAPDEIRGVTERVCAAIGVVPFASVAGVIAGVCWGPAVGIAHGAFAALFGFLVLEMLLAAQAGTVPSTQPWRPERAQLRARWPVYLIGFAWIATGFPVSIGRDFDLEVLVLRSWPATVVLLALIAAVAVGVRQRAIHKLRTEPPVEEDEFGTTTVTVRLT
jgi:hypothetical protein